MQAETTRLSTKKSLKGLFSSEGESDSTVEEGIPEDEMLSSKEDLPTTQEVPEETKSSSFYDEPDAFQ